MADPGWVGGGGGAGALSCVCTSFSEGLPTILIPYKRHVDTGPSQLYDTY